jgi:hypothetical protein
VFIARSNTEIHRRFARETSLDQTESGAASFIEVIAFAV